MCVDRGKSEELRWVKPPTSTGHEHLWRLRINPSRIYSNGKIVRGGRLLGRRNSKWAVLEAWQVWGTKRRPVWMDRRKQWREEMRKVGSDKEESYLHINNWLCGVSLKGLQSHWGVLILWLWFASHHWPPSLDSREKYPSSSLQWHKQQSAPSSIFWLDFRSICPMYSHSLGPYD